ncbi:unnamed protein product [Prorocentrum cordatum]|uniref:Vacuolar protein sorting-associated protein 26 n=1 Tax=Prorocentrum cordatum TaxID=2364126 RepID=A0ABN9T7I5_9DINO|nr:unnamed protein product [Polarella glacialis]
MSVLGGLFGSVCTVDITYDAEQNRKTAPLGKDKKGERAYIYTDGEDVTGSAVVSVRPGKKMEHQGIKVELVGQVDMLYDKASSYDFFTITKDLEPPGNLYESKQYSWKFGAVDKQNETYSGINVRLRYFVRITVIRNYASNITKEIDMVVQNLYPQPELNNTLKMEVGIEDCLHIEFEYDKAKYHLKDVVVGKRGGWIFPPCPHQDQAHGAQHRPPREHRRLWRRPAVRQRDPDQVRDHGRGACEGPVHPGSALHERVRPDAHVQERPEQVLRQVHAEPRADRRGGPEILQAAGDLPLAEEDRVVPRARSAWRAR